MFAKEGWPRLEWVMQAVRLPFFGEGFPFPTLSHLQTDEAV